MAGAAGLRREAALFFTAQAFLTRLPAPRWVGHEPGGLARASRYFPVVGLLVGAVAGLVWLCAGAALPAPIAAGLALAAMILCTGALHEDGLADCCDGLGGGATPERSMEIMRDSRIGAYACLGLIVVVGLRWTSLAQMAPWTGFFALLIAASSGRAAITLILACGAYAREDGAARDVAGGAGAGEAAMAAATAAAAGCLLGLAGAAAAGLAMIAGLLWLAYLKRRLGGYTGDGLGAAEQFGQIIALLTIAGLT